MPTLCLLGEALASAYEQYLALSWWVAAQFTPRLMQRLDGAHTAEDPVYTVLANREGTVVSVPPCVYPTAIRVATLSPDDRRALASGTWPNPSPGAVVATFPACEGPTVALTAGGTATPWSRPKAGQELVTGVPVQSPTLPSVFGIDGDFACPAPTDGHICKG